MEGGADYTQWGAKALMLIWTGGRQIEVAATGYRGTIF